MVGNGWYSGSVGFAGSQQYGTEPWYSAQLRHRPSPTARAAPSRPTAAGRPATGPIRADDLYQGETYDARLAAAGWDRPGFDDRGWTAPRVRTGTAAEPGGPGRQRRDRAAGVPAGRLITQPKPGVWVADLGQNFSRLEPADGDRPGRHHGAPCGTREVLNPDGTRLHHQPARGPGHRPVHPGRHRPRRDVRAAVHRARLPVRRADRAPRPRRPRPPSPGGRRGRHGAQTGTFTTSNTHGQPAAAQHPVGRALQHAVDADRLPAARRAARLDRRHRDLRARPRRSTSTSHGLPRQVRRRPDRRAARRRRLHRRRAGRAAAARARRAGATRA